MQSCYVPEMSEKLESTWITLLASKTLFSSSETDIMCVLGLPNYLAWNPACIGFYFIWG